MTATSPAGRSSARSGRAGFTLLELVVVLVILGLAAGLLVPRLTGGAWCRFDPGAAAQLRELLRAAAAYAAGGREAFSKLARTASGAAQLIGQMK